MDKIQIVDLEVFFRVGVPDEERASAQRLLISVEMWSNFSEAALADDLTKTIDYAAVSRRILRFGHKREWQLIEKLAVDLAETILQEFGPERVSVEVKKFIIPEAGHVAVRVVRPADGEATGVLF